MIIAAVELCRIGTSSFWHMREDGYVVVSQQQGRRSTFVDDLVALRPSALRRVIPGTKERENIPTRGLHTGNHHFSTVADYTRAL
jgi:hypothetical protein